MLCFTSNRAGVAADTVAIVNNESKIQNMIEYIKVELGVRKKELLSQNKLVEDQRLSQRVVQDMEMM